MGALNFSVVQRAVIEDVTIIKWKAEYIKTALFLWIDPIKLPKR